MSVVEEITAAVAKLPPEEFWSLTDHFIAMREQRWDAEMKEDARPGGVLDQMARAALEEYRQGFTHPLP